MTFSSHRWVNAEDAKYARQSAEYRTASASVRRKPVDRCSWVYGTSTGNATTMPMTAASAMAFQYCGFVHKRRVVATVIVANPTINIAKTA